MTDDSAAEVRRLLKLMPTENLKKAMRAFPRKAAGDREHGLFQCFLGEAFAKADDRTAYTYGWKEGVGLGFGSLGFYYEYPTTVNQLYQECVRELAERGEAVEPEVTPCQAQLT